ncbi:3735_t:CDS:2 [Acaulospora morrowiae]|uniref:3735_t:CDS:1 n=1 Tax=Acaulospora morrowiae TaxID=94023 RepID=A0A9N9BV72_9GLOM|nr:3735_t:CDS:2 [Acaulospora morrowiae]
MFFIAEYRINYVVNGFLWLSLDTQIVMDNNDVEQVENSLLVSGKACSSDVNWTGGGGQTQNLDPDERTLTRRVIKMGRIFQKIKFYSKIVGNPKNSTS